jgi:hypothetical protein
MPFKIVKLTESELYDYVKKQIVEVNTKNQKYLNYLLDKINTSGMDSLTSNEKESLTKLSNDQNIDDNDIPKEVDYINLSMNALNALRNPDKDTYMIDFSVDADGEWENIELNESPYTEEQILRFLKRIIKERKLPLGERTSGTIWIENDEILVKYEVFAGPGEDWDDDESYEGEVKLDRIEYRL